jgi:NhaA: Na+/H+ antiporter NhaA
MIILRTVKNFSSLNIAASILLFLMAILAAVIANSPMAPLYQGFLLQELHLRIGDFNLFSHGGHPLKMIEFINDCLMTVFFLAVGLEIKRELLVGELSSFRKASLPFVAACGGMLVPVIVYSLLVVQGTPETRGMAIPMATDIAFSLGVLSLLGKRVPLSLKIFLTAFAVVDDIGGILVIAIFYSSEVAYGYLIVAAVLYFFLYYMGKFGMTQKIFFLLIGVIIWYLFLQSGIHSTISGVILAFVIPARPRLDAGKYIKRIRDIIGDFPVTKSDNITRAVTVILSKGISSSISPKTRMMVFCVYSAMNAPPCSSPYYNRRRPPAQGAPSGGGNMPKTGTISYAADWDFPGFPAAFLHFFRIVKPFFIDLCFPAMVK